MRVSHAFVSHTHIDHFAGFDRLFRVCLHRPGPLHLIGPPGFIDQVEHRIRAFTWNLIGDDAVDFSLHVAEFHATAVRHVSIFRARDVFTRRDLPGPEMARATVLTDNDFLIEAVSLDHGIPSLAFALKEHLRVNVWRGALDELRLPVGPWLNEAKQAVRAGAPPDTVIAVPGARSISLGELMEKALRIGPGQRVAYVTDAAYTESNAVKVVKLAQKADQLFIEAVFLDDDASLAQATRHLTAGQAGHLAGLAGAQHVTPFHHSARYIGRENALKAAVQAAFEGRSSSEANLVVPSI
jgi:ribonuclease Z